MTVDDLKLLYDYSYWANRKLFAAMSGLSPDEFARPVAGSYGSIRNTLVHVLSAEAGWLERCGGPARGPKLEPDHYPTLDALTQAWARVEAEMRKFLDSLSQEDLGRTVEFANPRGEKRAMPIGQLLQHSANHAVHHRGQVALLVRVLGHVPGNVDILFYFAEKRQVPAW